MATEKLLEEFPPVSTAAWEAAIAADLKGADYDKKLIGRTDEGISVKPYFRAEDAAGLAWLDAAPGAFPYARGTRPLGGWRMREEMDAEDAEQANQEARAAVAAGADEIAFRALRIDDALDLRQALAGMDGIPVCFALADEHRMRLLLERASMRGATVTAGFDPLRDLDLAANILSSAPHGFVPFTLDAARLEEGGANALEEIGFTLAAGVDFLAALQERGMDVDRAAGAVEFHFAISSNYFFQIAKLRAFRMLWARAVESFGGARRSARARIAARTSRWNTAVYDPHVNILRATTEAMAAALGGADSITVTPFDECYEQPGEASRRLARNTQLLLRHEAHLARVADAGGGAYALEAITDSLARAGWETMQKIEARGGYRKACAEGMIAQALEAGRAAREKAVAARRRILTGTNQYANPAERALDRADPARMNTLRRGARMYEELRLRTERHAAAGGKTPHVLLAEIGDARMRGARAHFARNFFACAGFEITARRFEKAEEIAAAGGDLIVLCSADEQYAALAAELMPKLKALRHATPVLVAGNPAGADELRAAGVADLIHVRSNPVEVLTRWQERLGIEDKPPAASF